QALAFQPASLQAVCPTLRVLCCASCNLQDDSLGALSCLSELRRLDLSDNNVASLEAVDGLLQGLPRLLSLDLRGNPVARLPRYTETVVVMTGQLAVLDDQPVKPQQREALLRL
ncbi:uncharacterized protein HaLaN_09593, partial [Haematococcus lacustris]